MNCVTVRVPATTANLGPGFDCLGMALDIWNLIRFRPGGEPGVRVEGCGAGELSEGTDNLIYRAALRYLRELNIDPVPFSIDCENEIPLARGLGSSAAAIVGGMLGASALAGEKNPDMEGLLRLAADMEGHPDNVTAALFGGCQIVVKEWGKLIHAAVPIPEELRAVLFIPDVSNFLRRS